MTGPSELEFPPTHEQPEETPRPEVVPVEPPLAALASAGESPHAEVGGAAEVRMLRAFPKP